MRIFKQAFAAIMALILVIFALQNTTEVEISFLSWTVQTHRSVVVATSAAAGILIGWLMRAARG